MGADEKRERFARIREQIRQTARSVGQASLATGVLVLCAPPSGVSPSTSAEEIDVVGFHQAAAGDRISEAGQVVIAEDMPITDFGDTFRDFSDSTFGKV